MNEKQMTEEGQRKIEEMLLYADKFEGVLGETPVVRIKKVSDEEASKESCKVYCRHFNWERDNKNKEEQPSF